MAKFERIVRIPAGSISKLNAELIAEIAHELSERRVTAALAQTLRNYYQQTTGATQLALLPAINPPPPGQTEDQFVAAAVGREPYRSFFRPTYGERYTFLSSNGNVQFLYDDFVYEDIPPDVATVIVEASGPDGEIFNVNVNARPQFAQLKEANLNRVLIQGPDRQWVNDTYERLRVALESGKDPWKHYLYHGMPFAIWFTFFCAVLIEYRVVRVLSRYDWRMPFNGLELVVAFVALTLTLIVCAQLFWKTFTYLFPYFELEGNLTRRRKSLRWPIVTAVGALYAAAVLSIFGLR